MNVKTQEMYSEVYSILNMLGENYIKKLPDELFTMIRQEKKRDYNPTYISTINLEQQNISREALAMIALFHINYWCHSEQEKEELREIFRTNEEEHQAQMRKKYNPNDIFKNYNVEKVVEDSKEESNALIEYKDTVFRKVLNKIKKLLHL